MEPLPTGYWAPSKEPTRLNSEEKTARRKRISPLAIMIAFLLAVLIANSWFGGVVWEDRWLDSTGNHWLRFTTLFRTDQIVVFNNGQRFVSHREIYPWRLSFTGIRYTPGGASTDYHWRLRRGLPDLAQTNPPLPPNHPALVYLEIDRLRRQGEQQRAARAWGAAADDYARLVALEERITLQRNDQAKYTYHFFDNPLANPFGDEDLNRLIRLRLMANDLPGYRKSSADLLSRIGLRPDPMTANNTAWVFALAPNAVDDYTPVVKLSERAVKLDGEYTFLNTLGVLLCRAGKYEEAIQTIQQGQKRLSREKFTFRQAADPSDWLALAISHQHLGHKAEARQYLDRACREYEAEILRLHQPETPQLWSDPLETELFSREAHTLRDTPEYR